MPISEPLVIRQTHYGHPDGSTLVDEVQTYYASLYGGPDASPIQTDEFAPPHGAFFIAYAGDSPLAMGGWRFHAQLAGFAALRPAEIKRMYVRATARRRGLARLILTHLETTAAAAGADALILETGLPQADAVCLYRACGYVDVPHFGYYSAAPDAVHLGKLLGPPLVG